MKKTKFLISIGLKVNNQHLTFGPGSKLLQASQQTVCLDHEEFPYCCPPLRLQKPCFGLRISENSLEPKQWPWCHQQIVGYSWAVFSVRPHVTFSLQSSVLPRPSQWSVGGTHIWISFHHLLCLINWGLWGCYGCHREVFPIFGSQRLLLVHPGQSLALTGGRGQVQAACTPPHKDREARKNSQEEPRLGKDILRNVISRRASRKTDAWGLRSPEWHPFQPSWFKCFTEQVRPAACVG